MFRGKNKLEQLLSCNFYDAFMYICNINQKRNLVNLNCTLMQYLCKEYISSNTASGQIIISAEAGFNQW